MKCEEHRMASHTHLCSAGSPEAQGGNQLAEQGNHPFPNNFQLAVKYQLSTERCFLHQVFWVVVKEP